MKITNSGSEILRSGYANAIRGGAVEGSTGSKQVGQGASAGVPADRGDKVQISAAGRALAAQATGNSEDVRAELSPERIAQIRQKVLEGAYNSVNVVEEVARRMLERGDI